MSRFARLLVPALVPALVVLLVCGLPASAERPRPLGWAMDAMRSGNWDTAALLAVRDGPVAADIIEWHRLRAGLGTGAEVRAFLARRADWPGEELLRRQSEAAFLGADDAAVLEWFADAPPQTAAGLLRHAEALQAAGRSGEAEAGLVLAWRTQDLGAAGHDAFVAAHDALLAPHHVARLEAMLWQNETDAARRMFDLVPEGHVALAEAWLALRARSDAADTRIAAVPETLRDHPGLSHARMMWHLSAGRWEEAKALLLARSEMTEGLGNPQAWANRRRSLARDEMRDGEPARAYSMAAQHDLTEGAHYADLEWLAGYIALRQLDDAQTALTHFEAHRDATLSPISRGRAGYWIGRAHEALGNAEAAAAAYAEGAQYQTAFYGLLAAERGGLPVDPFLDGSEAFGDWRNSDLAQRDLFEAGMLLQASGEITLAERFWTHLAERLPRVEAGLLGQAAIDIGQPHLAVLIAKRVALRGETLHAPYFPLHPLAEADLPMAPEMLLAVARRESEFDPVVRSGAGAVGLMQIMPATGAAVARQIGVRAEHSTDRMGQDPVYNARLGAAYLSRLARRYDGNVVLMSIAYNAGPGRADDWQVRFGDLRQLDEDFDIVDWIEHIPFRETRNYVMRVTESLPIYRARLGGAALPVPFSTELTGASLAAFAAQGE